MSFFGYFQQTGVTIHYTFDSQLPRKGYFYLDLHGIALLACELLFNLAKASLAGLQATNVEC